MAVLAADRASVIAGVRDAQADLNGRAERLAGPATVFAPGVDMLAVEVFQAGQGKIGASGDSGVKESGRETTAHGESIPYKRIVSRKDAKAQRKNKMAKKRKWRKRF
jgi:hypothetical protein